MLRNPEGLTLDLVEASLHRARGLHAPNEMQYNLQTTLCAELTAKKITMVLEALYLTSTATTKISILLFYRRLSTGTVSSGFIYLVYAAIIFVVAYYFIFIINLFAGCQPIEAFWLQVDPFSSMKYHCINEGANLIAAGSISVSQDLLACGLPTILFWKLRIPPRQKFVLGAIFGIGFL